MTSTTHINFPPPDPAGVCDVTIDRDGNTFLTLNDPPDSVLNPSILLKKYIFRVSSKILPSESKYFSVLFSRPWKDRELREGKYHIRLHSLPAPAIYLLLATMHNPAKFNPEDNSYSAGAGLPDTIPLEVLVDIMLCADYLDLSTFKCQFSPDVVQRWFQPFWNEKGGWDLPRVYDYETMTWWCLAKYFGPRDTDGRSLQEAAEAVITWGLHAIQSFGLPVTCAHMDGLEEQRKWTYGCLTDVEDESGDD